MKTIQTDREVGVDQEVHVKRGALVMLVVALAILSIVCGCTAPADDYVRADAAAWRHYDADNRLDLWIDEAEAEGKAAIDADEKLKPGQLTSKEADALRKLNTGRRARISHAMKALEGGAK